MTTGVNNCYKHHGTTEESTWPNQWFTAAIQYEVYWDPGKGKVIAHSVITTILIIAFIKILCILNVL